MHQVLVETYNNYRLKRGDKESSDDFIVTSYLHMSDISFSGDNGEHTVDWEILIVKIFSSTTFPTKIKHVKYFVRERVRYSYVYT